MSKSSKSRVKNRGRNDCGDGGDKNHDDDDDDDDDDDGGSSSNMNSNINDSHNKVKISVHSKAMTTTRTKCQQCHQRAGKDTCRQQWCFTCCTSKDCVVHEKQRWMTQWKEQVRLGITPIQLQAQERRKLRIGGGMNRNESQYRNSNTPTTTTTSTTTASSSTFRTNDYYYNHTTSTTGNTKRKRNSIFHETNFLYQGDTIVIWDIQEYIKFDTNHNKNDALRKSIRRNKLHLPPTSSSLLALNSETARSTVLLRNNRKRFRRIMNDLYRMAQSATATPTTSDLDVRNK